MALSFVPSVCPFRVCAKSTIFARSSLSGSQLVTRPRLKLRCFRRPIRCNLEVENQSVKRGIRSRIPTYLTLARVLAVPALTATSLFRYFSGQRTLVTSIFILAAITDWADGYLARRWGAVSAFGEFLDPVADKLMVAAALVVVSLRFAQSSLAPVLAVSSIVILTREIFISALREWMASAVEGGRDIVKVGYIGKVKTAAQMIALSVLLFVKDAASAVGLVGTCSLCVSALLALYSAAGYVKAALPTFRNL